MNKTQKKPVLLLIVGVLGISMSSIFAKYSTAPSVLTAAYRLLWTVLLMTPVVFSKKEVRKELFSVDRKILLLSALSGFFLAMHFSTWIESLQHTSVASSTVIVCTEAIWVAIGYVLFMKGKLGPKAVAAMAVAVIGSIIIALADASSGGSSFYGDMLALISAIVVGAYTLLGRAVREKGTSTSVYTYIVYTCCSATLLIIIAFKRYPLFGFGWSGILAGLALAVFSTILGHSIFSLLLKYYSPAFISSSKLCEPVISSILAAFLFAEIPSLMQVVGSVIVLAGVVYYTILELKE